MTQRASRKSTRVGGAGHTAIRVRQHTQQEQKQEVAAPTAVETEAANIIDQAVTVKQSTEVAQCFVLGAISSLAYTRNIFPDHCFENQRFDILDNESAYEHFAKEHRESEVSKRKGTTRIHVLKRGRGIRADKFLDWLEKGVFDALQKGHLLGLHITILGDQAQSANVLETYTFTFHYAAQDDGAHSVTSFEVDGSGKQPMTLRMVRIAMRQLIRQTFVYCQRLPALPEHRYLKMHLTYNDTRPNNYHPPYFDDGDDDEMFYPDADWKLNRETAGAIDTGHHTVCLKISHLELEGMDEMDSIDMDNLTIPQTLEYRVSVSRFDDLDLEKREQPIVVPKPNEGEQASLQPIIPEVSETAKSAFERSTATQAQHIASDADPTPPNRKEIDLDIVAPLARVVLEASRSPSVSPTSRGSSSSRARQSADISQPEDETTRERLRVMLQPSQRNDVGHDTQQQHTQVYDEETTQAVPRLSQTVIGELEKRRSKQLPPRKSGLARQQDLLNFNLSESSDSVLCECEDDQDEANVIQCSFCMKWQHLQCYGYRRDGMKMPAEDHACYRCLLQGKDASLWDDLRWLALVRRAIHHLETSGFSTNQKLQADLKRPAVTTSLVITELYKKGFLVPTVGSKKSKAGKPRYSVNKNEPVWSRIIQEYFDPVAKIAHFYELPEMPNKTTQPTTSTLTRPQLRDKRQRDTDMTKELVTPKRHRRDTATLMHTLAVDDMATPDQSRH